MKRIYRFLTIGLVLVVLGAGYFFTNLTIFDRTFIQLKTSQKVRSKMYLNFDAASPLVITQNSLV